MKNPLFLLPIFLLFSCATQQSKMSKNKIYWVNSAKIPCEGLVPMHCLQIQKSEQINSGNWERFYSNIEGFDFSPGYIYKLSVSEEKIDPKEVMADASSVKYKLIKILEKKQDGRLRLYDIWALEAIGKESFTPAESQLRKHPTIELNLTENRYLGNDGCNSIMGKIEKADSEILELGLAAGTKMLCPNMQIPNSFNQALSQVKNYKISNLKLTLFDESGEELLRFRKVD